MPGGLKRLLATSDSASSRASPATLPVRPRRQLSPEGVIASESSLAARAVDAVRSRRSGKSCSRSICGAEAGWFLIFRLGLVLARPPHGRIQPVDLFGLLQKAQRLLIHLALFG